MDNTTLETKASTAGNPLTVLLIEDSRDYAALVERWLVQGGAAHAFALQWCDTLETGLERLSQGGVDVVLLDLGLTDSEGPPTFTAIRTRYPSLPVIVLSGADSESLALQMIQQGAQDYLVKTNCTPDLLTRALRYAVVRSQSRPAPGAGAAGQCRTIAILGSAGGAGATSVACTLAADLRYLTNQRVLLADLDLTGGLVSFTAGITSEHSILDALDSADRLNRKRWDEIVVHRAGELDILASAPFVVQKEINAETVRLALGEIARFYDWIVIDCGRLDNFSCNVVKGATDLFLVSSLGIPSLHQSKRTIDRLHELGVTQNRIRLILNQREGQRDLSESELSSLFGVEIFATLPEASQDLHDAFLQKRLPAVSGIFRKAVVAMARRLAGIPEEKPNRMPRPLATIAERFRKNREVPEILRDKSARAGF